MGTDKDKVLEERLIRLKEENISIRAAISFLKSENENLRKSIGECELVFHSDPAGMMVLQKGKIVNINRTMLDRLGYVRDEIIDMKLPDFTHPDDARLVRDLYKKIQSEKVTSAQHEIKLISRNGVPIFCELWLKKIRLRNKNTYLLNFSFIEKMKEIERENYLNKKREALVVMASGISYEMHRWIKDLERNIKAMESALPNKDNRFIVNNFNCAMGKMLMLTRSLDIISGADDMKERWVSLDINGIVEDAISEAGIYWREKLGKGMDNIALKSYLRSVSMIKGERTAIMAAVVNIILNAIEALHDGGEIFATTEDTAGGVCLYIQDNGPGIPEGIKDSIFDPFFTTRGGDSLGLGLSLCETIIERHGGKIKISSDENQGCTVEIKLPPAGMEKKVDGMPSNKIIRKARILIIQDNDFLREILSQMFFSKGLTTNTAESGWEGLGKMKKRKISLVIADSATLEMDISSFIEKCRRINPVVKIVMIKGREKDDLQESNGHEADLIIARPLDANRMVQNALNLIMS